MLNATPLQLFRLKLKHPKLETSPTLISVAAAAGLSPGNLSAWERGERPLGIRASMAICELYGTTAEELGELYDACRLVWLRRELAACEARIAANGSTPARTKKGAKKKR